MSTDIKPSLRLVKAQSASVPDVTFTAILYAIQSKMTPAQRHDFATGPDPLDQPGIGQNYQVLAEGEDAKACYEQDPTQGHPIIPAAHRQQLRKLDLGFHETNAPGILDFCPWPPSSNYRELCLAG